MPEDGTSNEGSSKVQTQSAACVASSEAARGQEQAPLSTMQSKELRHPTHAAQQAFERSPELQGHAVETDHRQPAHIPAAIEVHEEENSIEENTNEVQYEENTLEEGLIEVQYEENTIQEGSSEAQYEENTIEEGLNEVAASLQEVNVKPAENTVQINSRVEEETSREDPSEVPAQVQEPAQGPSATSAMAAKDSPKKEAAVAKPYWQWGAPPADKQKVSAIRGSRQRVDEISSLPLCCPLML